MTHKTLIQQAVAELSSRVPVAEKLTREASLLQEQASSTTAEGAPYTEEEIPELAVQIYRFILESEEAQAEVETRLDDLKDAHTLVMQVLREKMAAKMKCGKRMRMNEGRETSPKSLPEQLQYNQLIIESMQLDEAITKVRTERVAIEEEYQLMLGLLAEGSVKRANKIKRAAHESPWNSRSWYDPKDRRTAGQFGYEWDFNDFADAREKNKNRHGDPLRHKSSPERLMRLKTQPAPKLPKP